MNSQLYELHNKRADIKDASKIFKIFPFFISAFLLVIPALIKNETILLISLSISFSLIIITLIILKALSKKLKLVDLEIIKLTNKYLSEKGKFRFVSKDYLSCGEFYISNFSNKTSGNKFECTDTLIGPNFSSSFINVYYVIRTRKNSITVTLFKGRFYVVDIAMKIKGMIIIKEERDKFNIIPQGFIEVEFASINFGKKFNVYCNFEEEAFRRIKPQQILRIMTLGNYREGGLFITISPSKLYVGFNSESESYSAKDLVTTERIDEIIDQEVNLIKTFIKATQ